MKRREKWLEAVDVSEWGDLAARLHAVSRAKHDEVIVALRKIVEANEILASDPLGHVVDWDDRKTAEA